MLKVTINAMTPESAMGVRSIHFASCRFVTVCCASDSVAGVTTDDIMFCFRAVAAYEILFCSRPVRFSLRRIAIIGITQTRFSHNKYGRVFPEIRKNGFAWMN